MNTPLKNQIITQVQSLKETPFENFVVELFLKYYGSDGFIPTREKRDGGCDGIVVAEKEIIACYGPEKYLKKSFDKKAKDDFDDYRKNWEKNYPNWKMVVNHDVCPDELAKVEELKSGSKIWGLKNIISIIENDLSSKQRRDIERYLNVDNNFIATDYIREILDDLLSEEQSVEVVKYEKPIYLGDKVTLNFDQEDENAFYDEYEIYVESGVLDSVSSIMKGYDDNEINQIKVRVKTDFNDLKEKKFKNKIQQIVEVYRERYHLESDDESFYYIKAIVVHCFEQCLIGKKTKQENDNATSR